MAFTTAANVSGGRSLCWWGWRRPAFSHVAGAVPHATPDQVSVSCEVQCNTQHFHPVYLPLRNENLRSHKHLDTSIYSSSIRNCEKTETVQMLFSGWIDGQTVVCPERWKTTQYPKGACYWHPARISEALCRVKDGHLNADTLYVPFIRPSCKGKIKGMEDRWVLAHCQAWGTRPHRESTGSGGCGACSLSQLHRRMPVVQIVELHTKKQSILLYVILKMKLK